MTSSMTPHVLRLPHRPSGLTNPPSGEAFAARPHGPLRPQAATRWARVARELHRRGHVVVYAFVAAWADQPPAAGALRVLLDDSYRRYQRSDSVEFRRRLVASRRLMKAVLAMAPGVNAPRVRPSAVRLGADRTGRPYVARGPDAEVSLSHTGDLLVVGVSRRGRIGVDVEEADRPLLATGIDRLACGDSERRWLEGLPEVDRHRALVRLWTLKEAHAKALGEGLRVDLHALPFRVEETRVVSAPPAGAGWHYATATVRRRWCVGVAAHRTAARV
ncbi:MAG TPA: 4'-phosphopantetheinyl transferase superfamily protein [Pseudonocardiaceae bacterium]